MRRFARILCVLVGLVGMAFLNPVAAQTSNGAPVWVSGAGPGGTFPSAYEACKAQWQMYRGATSRFIGAIPWHDNWAVADCSWTTFQYLCHDEGSGGISSCGTVLPAWVNLICPANYTATVDGHCRKNPAPECKQCKNNGGHRNDSVGNPIILGTGSKVINSLDFETADGLFRIGRNYRSFQVGTPLEGTRLPRSLPRWLAGGWNFDFGYEIQLGTFSGTPASPAGKVAVLAPEGTGYAFILQSNGQWLPDPALGAANIPTDIKLEFVGTLPSDLATIRTSPNIWKLTDSEDNAWVIRTAIGPNDGYYDRGWPISRTARDGYVWNFAYNSDSSLASITDSFGRIANFSWYQFFTTTLASPPPGTLPYPQAVASIALPDGTSLRYTYDPPPAISPPSTTSIQRLLKFERLSAASAVLDSSTYVYEDTRFPTHVTGIIDNLNQRVATYAYDGDGQATMTQGASGTDSYSVEYGENAGGLTRRVTNALGKASNYGISSFATGPADFRLTQLSSMAMPWAIHRYAPVRLAMEQTHLSTARPMRNHAQPHLFATQKEDQPASSRAAAPQVSARQPSPGIQR